MDTKGPDCVGLGVWEDRETYPPLNRPSVKHATSFPRPAPIIKLVGLSISGIPVYVRQ